MGEAFFLRRETGSAPTAKSGAFVGDSIHMLASVPPVLRQSAATTALEVAARKATPFVRTETTERMGLANPLEFQLE